MVFIVLEVVWFFFLVIVMFMKGRIKKFSLMIIIIVYVYISYEIILGYFGNLELV